ncbi:MAG: S1 RNA-binding domain-containing protein [Lachnospiraceae bacterium]|nr:S1 RNA-binding domain-containing protein [Lachnospiraceae bacterium]
MIKLGKTQTLQVARRSDFGVYLYDPSASREDQVLLPKGQVPSDLEIGDSISVFIYKDSEDRFIATTATPDIELGQVRLLTVAETTPIGAFLQWGLTKDLLLPFKEQTKSLTVGEQILVALYVDKSNRLCATMKIYDYLETNSSYQKDDTVTGTVYELSDNFGVFVAIDNKYSALIPKQQVFKKFVPGDIITGRVTNVREDGKLTLSLREKSFLQMDDDASLIYDKLLASKKGMLPFHDKTDAEIIKREFQLSKNAFKRAIGRLMKEGKIRIEKDGIYL